MDFSETIVVYDIRVGRCSYLNECMNLEYYQICSNDDPGLTLTYFMARSIFGPLCFCMGKN